MLESENNKMEDVSNISTNSKPWNDFFLNGPVVSDDFFEDIATIPTNSQDKR